MAASFRDGAVVGLCLMVMVVVGSIGAEAQLTEDFYDDTCPEIYDIVKAEIQAAVAADARNAASLVRLHFHDCFVQGCDGSVLLNTTDDFETEQDARANINSIRGFPVIDAIKAKLEDACPQTVSCADIVAIASRDSAVEAGLTPGYHVLFGRRDSFTPASIAEVNASLPSPIATYTALKSIFAKVGLDEVDLVTLSGAHTIGRVNCSLLTNSPLTTSTIFNPTFHDNNLNTCNSVPDPRTLLLNLDQVTPDVFDNRYYKNLLKGDVNFISDETLFNTPGFNQALVEEFAVNPWAFAKQFGISSIKMGNIKPKLTEDEGEIRLHCAFVNDATSSLKSAASLVASQ